MLVRNIKDGATVLTGIIEPIFTIAGAAISEVNPVRNLRRLVTIMVL